MPVLAFVVMMAQAAALGADDDDRMRAAFAVERIVRACLDGDGGMACAGLGAVACEVATGRGGFTVGIEQCRWHEVAFWEAEYRRALERQQDLARGLDAASRTVDETHPPVQTALQRSAAAWSAHLAAACDHVATLWTGGSGQGTAVAECRLRLLAGEVLRLDAIR